MKTLLKDFRGQISWGRVCALCSLIVAVVAQFTGSDVAHVGLWLSAALGNYGASKVTEMIVGKTNAEN